MAKGSGSGGGSNPTVSAISRDMADFQKRMKQALPGNADIKARVDESIRKKTAEDTVKELNVVKNFVAGKSDIAERLYGQLDNQSPVDSMLEGGKFNETYYREYVARRKRQAGIS